MEPSKVVQICLPRFASNRHGSELPILIRTYRRTEENVACPTAYSISPHEATGRILICRSKLGCGAFLSRTEDPHPTIERPENSGYWT